MVLVGSLSKTSQTRWFSDAMAKTIANTAARSQWRAQNNGICDAFLTWRPNMSSTKAELGWSLLHQILGWKYDTTTTTRAVPFRYPYGIASLR